ncbi:transcription factor bHLH84-like [Miscanthus floridulus]|uniref:transcription factor bHLH84-like n=1 Tax=Miscanthus floridulus TaxID=154761 RepID=UPI003459CD0C
MAYKPANKLAEMTMAHFLAAPYPYQSIRLNDYDDDGQEQRKRHRHELGVVSATTSATYWPEPCHVTGPGADGASNSGGAGAYFDSSSGCYYYCDLAEPDVSLGINTLATLPCTPSIDLNLLGDGMEERSACVDDPIPPDPSPQPKRKVRTGRDGEDLGRHKKKGRASANKHETKAASKTSQMCSQESSQQSRRSCSGDESNCTDVNRRSGAHGDGGGGGNAKARAAKGSATDPQSLYARRRRERINKRLKILQKLVPNGPKVDISTMLEEAVHYVRFLQQQIKMLSSDEMWMYAPIAYNGMSLGIDLKISPR